MASEHASAPCGLGDGSRNCPYAPRDRPAVHAAPIARILGLGRARGALHCHARPSRAPRARDAMDGLDGAATVRCDAVTAARCRRCPGAKAKSAALTVGALPSRQMAGSLPSASKRETQQGCVGG